MYKLIRHLKNHDVTADLRDLATFANGTCKCTQGDTSVLVTTVCVSNDKPSSSFVPLTVDYRQKSSAIGRIPTTLIRRDLGSSDKEILTSRMIDRSIRTLFPHGFNWETQVVCNLLAFDGQNDPDVLAINGASASLAVSDIPWAGPVAAVRVGLIDDELVVNPTRKDQKQSKLNLIVTANTSGNILMLDGSCREPITNDVMERALKFGVKQCQPAINVIMNLMASKGKVKQEFEFKNRPTDEFIEELYKLLYDELQSIFSNHGLDKMSRGKLVAQAFDDAKAKCTQDETTLQSFDYAAKIVMRRIYVELLRNFKTRFDGRGFEKIRNITCDVDLHRPLHGSALFRRGQTQVFCSTTLDSPDAAVRTDLMTLMTTGVKEKNFMLHYDFPPYATNEIGRIGSRPGRREIGHGALAENAIRALLPEDQEFTIRLNCEVLESAGSSSMASVCAGSMSLMDAGVKIPEHVAGVAMGLFNEASDNVNDPTILTDILGLEDFMGDMDFKIAGTKDAITALQLDVKLDNGLDMKVIKKSLLKARAARSTIVGKMSKAIQEPRTQPKDCHPVMSKICIPSRQVGKLFGFGKYNIKKIAADTGVRISFSGTDLLDEDDDDNVALNPTAEPTKEFVLFAPNPDALKEAQEMIDKLLKPEEKEPELEFNGIYTATIVEIRDNGCMVTLYPGMRPALLHLSQLDTRVVRHPDALDLKVGQQIQLKYFGRDPSTGAMRLSRRSLLISSANTKVRDLHKV